MQIIKYKKLAKELIDDWYRLWLRSKDAHFFNSPEWFKVNLKTYKYKRISIFALYKKGALVALLPLVQDKVFGIKLNTDANTDNLLLIDGKPSGSINLLTIVKKDLSNCVSISIITFSFCVISVG